MSLSRKRRRELKKLQRLAETVLDEQRTVIGHAGSVLSEAGYQARQLGSEHLAPRVAGVYNATRPYLNRLKRAGIAARAAVTPYTSAAVLRAAETLAAADRKDLAKQLTALGAKTGLAPQPKKKRFGAIAAAVAGVSVAAAVGYSLFQAFRDDEDVWIAPESE